MCMCVCVYVYMRFVARRILKFITRDTICIDVGLYHTYIHTATNGNFNLFFNAYFT